MTHEEKKDIWSRLAEPLPNGVISWRMDGKPSGRDGKFYARYVAYIEANTARERLDAVVPGEWDLTLELLPPAVNTSTGEEGNDVSFKARLQILGVIREDIGTGRDYKAAATDAFKRAAVRFGIAHELYAYEQNWVQVDSLDKYAKPLEDPGVAYARRFGSGSGSTDRGSSSTSPVERVSAPARQQETSAPARGTWGNNENVNDETPDDAKAPSCPKCGGKMWDNRLSKRNPKAPDFKCRDRSCDGVIWPARAGNGRTTVVDNDGPAFPGDPGHDEIPKFDTSPLGGTDDIPF